MTTFTEITYKKKIETGKISIHANEDYNFVLVAGGKLPRKKDIINAIELLYKELESKGYDKLNKFFIEIKSKRSQTKKRKWNKNRRSVWSYKPGAAREEFFKKVINGKS